jgi:hypothetical protein
VQSNILARSASPNLAVFVVWVPFLAGTRQAVNTSVLPDRRVIHFWDGSALSSQWFSAHVTHTGEPTWDYFLLFGPHAHWGATPGPVVSQGGPVVFTGPQLLATLTPLLR